MRRLTRLSMTTATDRHDAEQPLQDRLRDQLRGDAAKEAAGGRRHLEQHPSRMLISCLPARPADTVLDVAMTVVRLIAAAALNEKPRTSFRKGTRKTPPPSPRAMPRPPAMAPAAKIRTATPAVMGGTRRYCLCACT